jgi:hypothetical protein
VYCSHEGLLAQVYPAQRCDNSDILHFIEYFAWDTKHGAFHAVGDIGTAWPGHLANLPSFTTAMLLRHPARLLNTRLTVYPHDQSFTQIPPESRTCIQEIWDIDLNDCEPMDRIFLHDAFIFASQVWALDKVDLVIRIEDLRDPECCGATLKALTGLDYDRTLVERAIRERVNRRTQENLEIRDIVERFTPRQRHWYTLLLSDVLPYFGYSLLDEPKQDGMAARPLTSPARKLPERAFPAEAPLSPSSADGPYKTGTGTSVS